MRHRDAALLLLLPDERYPGETVEALARWVYRYRSELAPFGVAVALFVTGLTLHHRQPRAWPLVVLVTALVASSLATGYVPWSLPRGIERAYAATVAGVAGTWLAVATALGVGRVLALLLGVGTLLGSIPWWRHRRRRARVRVERTIEAWPEIAEAVGLTGSRVLSAVADLWGWRARVGLARGQTTADVIARIPALESGLATRTGALRVEADPDRADRCVVRVLSADPHATPLPWPGPSVASVAEPIELGVFEDAEPVRVSFLRRHALVGGIAGSGKSGVLNVILANLATCPDVVLWGIDLKGGMELRPWASCLDRLATTPAEAATLLGDAVRVLDGRASELAGSGSRVWEPRPDAPALVVVVDEYAELAEHAPGAVEAADSIARRGRAVAVTLLAATQRPTQDAMGHGAVRAQMDIRVCLRVRERRDADLILGQGMLAAGWHAHALDAPGKFLVSVPGSDTPRRARAYLVTDDTVSATAARHAPHRPHLDGTSADATGPRPFIPTQRTGEPTLPTEPTTDPTDDPEEALWNALQHAPDGGLSVPELMITTGKGRTWVYDRLQAAGQTGRATQVSRGRWRVNHHET
jgi:S-DNA-T family DNA segregation ATPase FtsK/SpoIIIE